MERITNSISQDTASILMNRFSDRQGEILAFVRLLVESESPSGDESGIRSVVDLLASAAQSIKGVDSIERIPSPGFGEHLLIRAFTDSEKSKGSILLVGHTDTVHARGSLKTRPWRTEDNHVYAPGIFDMKANCALAIEALHACSELELVPRREVVMILTCDEEIGSETGRPLIETHARAASCALVLEPPASGGRVKTGRKGTGIFTIDIEGVAAHAGLEPEKGASAILELARLVEKLHAMNDHERGINVNVGVINGGTRSNVVAASARAEVDLRFSTIAEGRRVETEILNSQPVDNRIRIHVSGGINRPPLERSEKVLSLYRHAKEISTVLGFELGEAQVGGASDGNFVAALGVPVLDGLGIDGDGAHAAHEHINVDDIARRGALLSGMLLTL